MMKKSDTHLSPLIEVKNLTKEYKVGGSTLVAVDDATLTIPEGSFTIIFGPSGSGKSTLLHAMMGIDPPTRGTVTYEGKSLYAMPSHERAYFRAHTMGVVRQDTYWVKSLSVIENVALPMLFQGISREAALEAAEKSLERINMGGFADKMPSKLSGGEQQRVAMARALVNNPSYIVADEPTGNLDTKNGDEIIKLLLYLNKELGRTVVLVTHNIEYLSLASQIVSIEDGQVEQIQGSEAKNMADTIINETRHRSKQWGNV